MSSTLSALNMAMHLDLNSPPGLVHPFLQENYAWVDERLEELYYNYCNDIIEDTYDDKYSFDECDIENQYDNVDFLPCPANVKWVNYRTFPIQHRIESSDTLPDLVSEISMDNLIRSCQVNNDHHDYYFVVSSDSEDYDFISDIGYDSH